MGVTIYLFFINSSKKMKLLWIQLYKHNGDKSKPFILTGADDLSTHFNFFQRGTVREHLQFAARTMTQRTTAGTRQTVSLKELPYKCHIYVRVDNLAAVVVGDNEYPQRVAFSLLNKVLKDFVTLNKPWATVTADQRYNMPTLATDLAKYQKPEEADKIMKIQQNLEEVKGVMHKNIDEVLKRGETLDNLMAKSDDLSAVSHGFYKKAKKNNQCCKAL